MPEPQQLNELLKGKTITSVEPGTTPGWMIINLEPQGIIRNCEPGDRAFLTVFVGGRNGSSDDNVSSTCALHLRSGDHRAVAYMIRDGRDPKMPMASADKATGEGSQAPETHVDGSDRNTCNYEFEYEGEIDRCGLPADVHGLCEAHYKRLTTPSDPVAEVEQALKAMRGKEEL